MKTKQQREEEFMAGLQGLLDKHRANLDIRNGEVTVEMDVDYTISKPMEYHYFELSGFLTYTTSDQE